MKKKRKYKKEKKNSGKIISITGMSIGAILMLWSFYLFKHTDGFFDSVHSDIFGAGLVLFIAGGVYFLFKQKLIT